MGEYDSVEKFRFDDLVDVVTLVTTVTNQDIDDNVNQQHWRINCWGISNLRSLGTTTLQRIKFDDYANTIHSNSLSNQVYDAVSVSGY